MKQWFKKGWVGLLIVALVAGACSKEDSAQQASEDPQAAFTEALDALAAYEGASITFSIRSTPESLSALDEGGAGVPPDIAEKILGSSITIEAKEAEDPADSAAHIAFNLAGSDVFEMIFVDQSLYVRAQVRELLETFGQDASVLDAAVAQGEAAGFDFIGPAIEGEWIGIEGIDQLAEQLTGQPIAEQPSEDQAQAVEALTNVLKSNVTVTSEGEDDVGAHVVATLNIRETAEELYGIIESLGQLPPGTAVPDFSEVPDGDVSLDAWISDGKLVQLELDFLQFAALADEEVPAGVEELAFRMTIAEFTDDIAAPDGAVLIDPAAIMQGIFGLQSGGLGGATEPVPAGGTIPELGIACSDLQGLRPQDIKAFLKGAGRLDLYEATQEACPELF